MWEDRQSEYGSIWSTALAVLACMMIAAIILVDLLGSAAEVCALR